MIFSKPETTGEKFKVVDSYKGCDVVQYTDSSQRYQYFLYCSWTKFVLDAINQSLLIFFLVYLKQTRGLGPNANNAVQKNSGKATQINQSNIVITLENDALSTITSIEEEPILEHLV